MTYAALGERAIWTPEHGSLGLLSAWQFYLWEHCRKKGQNHRRVEYVANKWLHVMGGESTPETWKHEDVEHFEAVRRAEGVVGPTIRHNFAIQTSSFIHRKERHERKSRDRPANVRCGVAGAEKPRLCAMHLQLRRGKSQVDGECSVRLGGHRGTALRPWLAE